MSTNPTAILGVIGLGSMGMGAACSAVRQGTPTWGFDPRPEALTAFGEVGGHPARSVAELAAQCDAVLVLVVNAAQTEQVLFGEQGLADHPSPAAW
jgi:putative dehydrogenase